MRGQENREATLVCADGVVRLKEGNVAEFQFAHAGCYKRFLRSATMVTCRSEARRRTLETTLVAGSSDRLDRVRKIWVT